MNKIKKLDPVIIDRIAAGEVIEKPASAIKELIENSIDAKANKIEILTYKGGTEKIIVKDNGEGITKVDLPLTIEKHATSKITTIEDIENILSYGFRGEALSSLASVSHLEIQSKYKDEATGNRLVAMGGKIIKLEPFPCLQGTKVIVENLFFSTPVRKKFLKTDTIENKNILKEIIKLSLANPSIHFIYNRDDKQIFNMHPVPFESLPERINLIFKNNIIDQLLPLYFEKNSIKIKGWIGKPRIQNSLTDKQYIFINNRPVEIKNFSYIIKNSYGDLIPDEAKPIYFLFMEIPPSEIDVNVHPAKKEIRFLNENSIFQYTIESIRKTLIPNIPLSIEKKSSMARNIPVKKDPPPFLYPVEEILKSNIQTVTMISEQIPSFQKEEKINSDFLPTKHFGILFGTYILAADQDNLFIIDQHTAHERIHYEKKREYLQKYPPQLQILLNPIIFHLNQEEIDIIEEHRKVIRDFGLQFDFITKDSIAIREIPDFLEINEKDLFIKIIHKIIKGFNSIEIYDEYIARKACLASFKKNDYIHPHFITQILIDLSKCKEPARCPHGRPTMIKISRSEMENLFYRKGF